MKKTRLNVARQAAGITVREVAVESGRGVTLRRWVLALALASFAAACSSSNPNPATSTSPSPSPASTPATPSPETVSVQGVVRFDFQGVPDATTCYGQFGGPFTLTFMDGSGNIIGVTKVAPRMNAGISLVGIYIPCFGKADYSITLLESDFVQVDVGGLQTFTIAGTDLASHGYEWNLRVSKTG